MHSRHRTGVRTFKFKFQIIFEASNPEKLYIVERNLSRNEFEKEINSYFPYSLNCSTNNLYLNFHLNLYFDTMLRDSFIAMKNLNETEEICFGNFIKFH